MEFDKNRMEKSPDYPKMREMIGLLIECRDALPAISLASAKLHNVDLSLADKIEKCLKPWEMTTPDNIAPKPDYQQQRIEAANQAFIRAQSSPDDGEYDFVMRQVLKAADAVPRPTQPEVMNAELLLDKIFDECLSYGQWDNEYDGDGKITFDGRLRAIQIIEQRDEAIRQSERDKAKALEFVAHYASRIRDDLQAMYDAQDSKEYKGASWPRDIFESRLEYLVEMANDALTNYDSENSHD